MTLFFVLSGFVMWVNYAESFHERFWASLWRFGVARFARLYPLYLAVGLYVLIRSAWTSKLAIFQLPDALLFIPLLQAWVPGSNQASAVFAIPPLRHAWSISVEMFLYLCFPAIALLIIGVRRGALLALALLNAAVCFLVIWIYVANIPALTAYFAPGIPTDVANMWIGYYSPLTRMGEFLSGCIVGAIIMRSREGTNAEWHSLCAAASIAVLLFAAALYSTPVGLSHEVLTLLTLPAVDVQGSG
jgi:peptidoglycan/LPS O-acetylase OafA/YrhL